MKVSYTTKNGRMTVEFEVSSQKELFRELHRFQEVFEDTATAKVHDKFVESDDIRYVVRKSEYLDPKTNKSKAAEYFETRVGSGPMTGWKKQFGVLDDGTEGLFPKRKVEGDGLQPGFNGWHKYVGGDN